LNLADGALTARQILERRVTAKLVMLSACWSGVTNRIAPGRVLRLAEAFLLAGADAVVGAPWPIRDLVASEFIKAFYRSWLAGAAAAEAVSEAMEEIRGQPDWHHPHWWGAFVVRGRIAPPITVLI
jgi:CHAT domain-containing protein